MAEGGVWRRTDGTYSWLDAEVGGHLGQGLPGSKHMKDTNSFLSGKVTSERSSMRTDGWQMCHSVTGNIVLRLDLLGLSVQSYRNRVDISYIRAL